MSDSLVNLLLILPGGSVVKNRPAVQEPRAQSLGREDPLDKGMATQSSILVWRIPWTEESGGPQSMGSQSVRYDWAPNAFAKSYPTLLLQAPCLFQRLIAACIPWLVVPSSIFKVYHSSLCFHTHIVPSSSVVRSPSASLCKNTCDFI